MNVPGNVITRAHAASSAAVASALSRRQDVTATAKDAGNANKTETAGKSNITSNDFLTLLVSELKNQDPTQPTDPNAYIQQLVGVNSLQQLIQINKGLAAIEPSAPAAPGGSTT